MRERLRMRFRNHPIPCWVHPILLLISYWGYGYYFSVINIPVESALDAFYLAVQQLLFFYPAICWALPDTLQGLADKWLPTLLKLLLLLFVAENFINVVSVLYGQLDVRFSSWTDFIYDAENGMWSFPLVSATLLVTFFYQTVVILMNEQRLKRKVTAELNRRLDEVSTEWYDAQLNPHLMNSMLTTVRQLVAVGSPKAGEAVEIMTRIIRYYLKLKPGTASVPLKDELGQAERLLALYSLCHGRRCYLRWDIRLTDGAAVLVPTLLIPMLVKNILKHGNVFNPDRQAIVHILVRGERLVIRAENVIREREDPGQEDDDDTHTGLFQIERKLNQRYGEDCVFTHSEIADEFHVYLEIPLQVVFFD